MCFNPDFDRPFTVNEADSIVRRISEGKMRVRESGNKIILRSSSLDEGHRLFAYELTRWGLARAVVEYFSKLPNKQ